MRRFFNFKHKPSLLDCPTETDLKRWATSHWIEYQAWLFHHSFLTLHDWQQLRQTVLAWPSPPRFSIVTPVFNTPPAYLRECIYSVQTQAYPYWEQCLVDDGSTRPDTLACLQELTQQDPRLRLLHLPHNQGICEATNQAIQLASGDYVAFLDHDDRLATDALFHVAHTLLQHPETDIVYTDRDMLSPEGYRYMHLFKPDWSPETLLSGNYLFHLLVYRRTLLQQVGGIRPGLEGSQDYDLILRATDTPQIVRHLPKMLYHWRQHPHSVSLQHNVKEYAYQAGLQALQDTLQRRTLRGTVTENTLLWRGHYRVQLQPALADSYRIVTLTSLENYALQVNQFFQSDTHCDSLILLGPSVQPLDHDTLAELIAWLQIPQVGLVTGKILDSHHHLLHAGLIQRPNGQPLSVYAGHPETTPGYMAVTAITRNVSTPHPACCAIKRTLWETLQGLQIDYTSPYSLFDFALRALVLGYRTVYTPFARFLASDLPSFETWSTTDRQHFTDHWGTWLNQGDPYYNPHLTLELNDMGIDNYWPLEEPKYPEEKLP